MPIEIAYQCSKSVGGIEWLACTRSVVSMVVSLFVIALSVYCVQRMYRQTKRATFEMLPMMTALLQACLQFSLTCFSQSVYVIVAALYAQAVTFSLVAYSFTVLHYRLCGESAGTSSRRTLKVVLSCFGAFWSAALVLLVLTLVHTFQIACSDFLSVAYYVPICLILATALVASVYGFLLVQRINEQCKAVQRRTSDAYAAEAKFTSTDDQAASKIEMLEVQQRAPDNIVRVRRQIVFVVCTFWVTSALQFTMDEIRENYLKKSDFDCENDEFQPSNVGGEMYMFAYLLIQLIPCTIVPYGFYYLPSVARRDAKNRLDLQWQESSFSMRASGEEDDEDVNDNINDDDDDDRDSINYNKNNNIEYNLFNEKDGQINHFTTVAGENDSYTDDQKASDSDHARPNARPAKLSRDNAHTNALTDKLLVESSHSAAENSAVNQYFGSDGATPGSGNARKTSTAGRKESIASHAHRKRSQAGGDRNASSTQARRGKSIAKETIIGPELDAALELRPEDFHLRLSPSGDGADCDVHGNRRARNKESVNDAGTYRETINDSRLLVYKDSIDVE